MQRESRRRVLVIVGKLLESTNLALREGKLLKFFVERQICIGMRLPKRFVRALGFPEVARYVSPVTKGIAQEESSLVRRIAPE